MDHTFLGDGRARKERRATKMYAATEGQLKAAVFVLVRVSNCVTKLSVCSNQVMLPKRASGALEQSGGLDARPVCSAFRIQTLILGSPKKLKVTSCNWE